MRIYDFHLDRDGLHGGLGEQGASPETNEREDNDLPHLFTVPH
jgi:hypothetical protein